MSIRASSDGKGDVACPAATTTPKQKYEYRPPVNSYFYYNVLSPFCQYLVEWIFPNWATPDLLTVTGFICGVCSALCVNSNRFILAGLFWQLYCIFDNCDGKQARRLKLSSCGGEFMDHATDSVITSLAGFVMMKSALNVATEHDAIVFNHIALPFTMLIGNVPYFIGIWGQAAYGQVLMGLERVFDSILDSLNISGRKKEEFGQDRTPEYLSVDEYNFFMVPGFCFVRALVGDWFTRPIESISFATGPLAIKYGLATPSIAICLVYKMMLFATITSIAITYFLLKGRRGQFFIVPFGCWIFISLYWSLPFVVTACTFSLISFEVLVKQLHIHKHTNIYIMYPVLLELIFVVDVSAFFGDAATELPLPNNDAKAKMILALSTAGILFTYKNVIHARNEESNIPWVITKKQQLEMLLRSRVYGFFNGETNDKTD